MAPIIKSPPIVGVPDLLQCDSGPSTLAVSPYFFFLSQAINGFPNISINKNANTKAIDPLINIDLNTLSTPHRFINNCCNKYNIF